MALKIRLARRGTTNRPFYHVVLTDSRNPRDGNFLEKLGTYDPLLPTAHDRRLVLTNVETVKEWLAKGAQPSERLHKLFAQLGLMKAPKIANRPQKSAPGKKAQDRAKEKADKAAAAAEASTEAAA
jgi:small subunit ribosomal protein S16